MKGLWGQDSQRLAKMAHLVVFGRLQPNLTGAIMSLGFITELRGVADVKPATNEKKRGGGGLNISCCNTATCVTSQPSSLETGTRPSENFTKTLPFLYQNPLCSGKVPTGHGSNCTFCHLLSLFVAFCHHRPRCAPSQVGYPSQEPYLFFTKRLSSVKFRSRLSGSPDCHPADGRE